MSQTWRRLKRERKRRFRLYNWDEVKVSFMGLDLTPGLYAGQGDFTTIREPYRNLIP